ncbi:MAG TPA: zinc-binding alcohol dehydrogenase [Thermoanaerobaculia bacterium]|nr:zinc-binding alcohol dehydrogenase [Thermoanaerobaculia bacterium]
MKRLAVVFEAPRRVSVREEELAGPGAGEVQVATEVSGVSAGTELLVYRGEAPAELAADEALPALTGDLRFPLRYGYAAVGRVVETGAGIDRAWLGRRVLAFQPHQSHFHAAPGDLHVIPDGVDAEDAAFLPNVETAVSFVMDGRPVIGERVAVLGQGVVGLLTTALLASSPLAALVTADRFPRRRQASRELGAGSSLDPAAPDFAERLAGALGADSSGGGADLVYELSGDPRALDRAIAVTGFGGRVVIGSWYGTRRAPLDLGGRFHRSRIRLLASQVSTLAPEWSARWSKARRLEVAWEAIRRLRPSRLVTHRLPLAEAPAAYDLLDRRPEEAIQVILEHRR